MGSLDDFDQLVFSAIFCGRGSPLVLVAEIERIRQVVARGESPPAFRRRWQPEAGVPGLRNLRHFLNQLIPVDLEEFEHRLGAELDQGKGKAACCNRKNGEYGSHRFCFPQGSSHVECRQKGLRTGAFRTSRLRDFVGRPKGKASVAPMLPHDRAKFDPKIQISLRLSTGRIPRDRCSPAREIPRARSSQAGHRHKAANSRGLLSIAVDTSHPKFQTSSWPGSNLAIAHSPSPPENPQPRSPDWRKKA